MPRGLRQGFYLEAWKFSVYLSLPIFASWYYSFPETQRYWADYWQFIKYPENPNTNVKQKIRELAEQKEKEKEQRLVYRRQLEELQRAAKRTENYDSMGSAADGLGRNRSSWWRTLVGRNKGSE